MKAATGFAIVHALLFPCLVQAQPVYNIIDIGVLSGDGTSQGFFVSPNGIATGRSITGSFTATRAFSWTQSGGITELPNLTSPARPFGVGNGVNDNGVVVGTGSTTSFGSNPLPLIWQGGVVSQLPLPTGQTLGRANAINIANVAVGSVNSGSSEVGAMYSGGVGTVITQTTSNGSFLRTATGINNSGRIVGNGIDPNNAAVNVGYVLDTSTNMAFSVGALPGMNGALNFGVSNAGHVVGSSMLNQGAGSPFIFTDSAGILAIPLPTGTTQGSARGVNSSGMAVGIASSAFAIPFLFDGTNTFRLGDLIPAGSGWDLLTNTSSSALGISEDGIIVGTGVFNGAIHAYAMVPVPEPGSLAFGLVASAFGFWKVRRRFRTGTTSCRDCPNAGS
jgi:hypothetical protein